MSSTCSFPCWSVSTLNAEPESPGVPNKHVAYGLCLVPAPLRRASQIAEVPQLSQGLNSECQMKSFTKNVRDSNLHVYTSCFVQTLTFLSPLCHLTSTVSQNWHHGNHQKNAFIPHSCGSVVAAAIPGHVECSMGDYN